MGILNFLFSALNWLIKNADGSTLFVTIFSTIIIIILLHQNRQLYRSRIKNELTKQQMMKVETLIINAKKMLIENYLSLLIEIAGQDNKGKIMASRDYHHFKFVLSDVMYELKSRMRFFFIENHLLEMTETEFNYHINKRSEELINEFTKLLDDSYYIDSIPDRITLYDKQQPFKQKGREMIEDCFREGRNLAQKFNTRKGKKEYNL